MPVDMRCETIACGALCFGNGQSAGPSNWLFFTAGISDETRGLFGFFTSADKSARENNGDDE
jgi:hypothetical protein